MSKERTWELYYQGRSGLRARAQEESSPEAGVGGFRCGWPENSPRRAMVLDQATPGTLAGANVDASGVLSCNGGRRWPLSLLASRIFFVPVNVCEL
jgi:hypothetical protein